MLIDADDDEKKRECYEERVRLYIAVWSTPRVPITH